MFWSKPHIPESTNAWTIDVLFALFSPDGDIHGNSLSEVLLILSFSRKSQNSDWVLQWWYYEKIYLESYIDNQYICLKNNTVDIRVILRIRILNRFNE